ncbi:MAG: NUDIX domain-containing protein [Bacteroidales bacterium]|nr:NUDIX domain-containing protein [Bacteroidales bacterium]
MNAKELIRKMLPGLLPLLIFIIADEVFDTVVSLSIAIAVGIFQAIWIFIKEKRFDYFVLLDTGLIIILGLISIISHDELFFKLKPGIVQVIMCIMLLFIAFAPPTFLAAMMGRYGLNTELNEESVRILRRNMKLLSVLLLLHTGLVFYSAFYMSKEAWGFISGVLLYLIFGVYFLAEFLRMYWNKRKFASEEWVPLVDEAGKIVGKAPRSMVHKDKNLLHPVIHVHIFNKERKLFLQKRASNKLVQPGKWDTAVGGHISWGETIEQTIKRETFEELGIELQKTIFIGKYIWHSEIESELIYVFITEYNNTISPKNNEIDDGKFWSKKEIELNLNKGIFTPNFEHEIPYIEHFFDKKNKW